MYRLLATAVLLGAVVTATPACAATSYRGALVVSPRADDRAFDRGFHDGFDDGRSDARHHRRFEPERAARFRSADHDYDRHYGPRTEWQRVYRDGFRQGYDRGFAEYR